MLLAGPKKVMEKKAKANPNVPFIGVEALPRKPFPFILFGVSFLTSKTAAFVPGISILDLLLAHRTLFLPSTQRICNQSKPQRDREVPPARLCRLTNPACCRLQGPQRRTRHHCAQQG